MAYADTTIFGRTAEVNAEHALSVAAVFAQPWGSTDVGASASQYLTRPEFYNAGVFGNVDLRVARGLSLRLSGSATLVRDQLNLPALDPSDEEVLTQQRELATSFRYFASVGVSYSFGSIYNQVVNRRFGG